MNKKLTLFIVIFILNIQQENATSMSWGNIRNGHVLLFDQFFHDRNMDEMLQAREFSFSTRGIRITAIHVTDLTGDEGGKVAVIFGGVGFSYVKLKLIPNDHFLLLNIEIFGAHDDRFS